MHQVSTWIDLMLYTLSPVAAAAMFALVVLFAVHALAQRSAAVRTDTYPRHTKIAAAVLLVISIILAAGAVDTWTFVRYFGGRHLPIEARAWRDSIFGLPLGFYLFDLPFYVALQQFVLALVLLSAATY